MNLCTTQFFYCNPRIVHEKKYRAVQTVAISSNIHWKQLTDVNRRQQPPFLDISQPHHLRDASSHRRFDLDGTQSPPQVSRSEYDSVLFSYPKE